MKKVKFIDSVIDRLNTKRKKEDKKTLLKIYAVKYIPLFFMFILNMNFIIKLLLMFLWWVGVTVFYDHRDIMIFNPIIRIWFGVPGSGKTTMASWIAKQSMKHHYKVLSNFALKGAYKLDDDDLGKYDMSFNGEGCHTIIDEALVKGLYNRNFKEFAKSGKPLYFSEHRHMDNMVDVFSQGYDIDLNVKQRAGQRGLFHLSRLGIKGFVMYRRIKKVFFIKKDDKQFIDGFQYAGLPRICYVKSVWDMFDTKDMTDCPKEQKVWQLWEFDDNEPLGV